MLVDLNQKDRIMLAALASAKARAIQRHEATPRKQAKLAEVLASGKRDANAYRVSMLNTLVEKLRPSEVD